MAGVESSFYGREDTSNLTLLQKREHLFLHPDQGLHDDYDRIYHGNQIQIGWPEGARRTFHELARPHTSAIIGIQLGDEGKGRIGDNKIEAISAIKGVKKVIVARIGGGNNAGHTTERDATPTSPRVKLDTHVTPSFALHDNTIGIMDRGVLVHPEDLMTEIDYIEDAVGDTRGRLFLSKHAQLVSDLERAQELFDRWTSNGQTDGGTGRGIGPGYAAHTDRTGLQIEQLQEKNWAEEFVKRYEKKEKMFGAFGWDLADIDVPDFNTSHRTGREAKRKLGKLDEYMDRIKDARDRLLARDMIRDTYIMHRDEIYRDLSYGVIFEGAQAIGLDNWTGTWPDVTSSDTSSYGIRQGTGFWLPEHVREKVGIIKIPYASSVGARKMPTHIELDKNIRRVDQLGPDATDDQYFAAFAREEGHEFGTTTGRPRDINYVDLEFMRYNIRIGNIDVVAATHIDISREDIPVKVCTHYTDEAGNVIPYENNLKYLKNVKPHYIELPGWDGEACQRARTFEELPENAKKFLAFIQARTGAPIVAATNGPRRNNIITFPGYNAQAA